MKIFLVQMIACWILIAISPTTSHAADWSVLAPEAVCSYLDWTDAKKIMLVGGGKNLSDVNDATEALKKNLQNCPKVSFMITAEALGDVSALDDEAIVTKAAKIPIDFVLVVRVFPEAGQSSLTATFYDAKGESVTAFLADTRTALVAKSPKQDVANTVEQEDLKAVAPVGPNKKAVVKNGYQEMSKPIQSRYIEHKHDGFFLRLSFMGLGYGNFSSEGARRISYKGFSTSVEISLGYAIIENLIVHFGVSGPILLDPTYSSGGISEKTEGVSVGSGGPVGGLTYYFMPLNLYLTAMVGSASMDLTVDGERIAETEDGISFQFSIGKEWWTTRNWGVGVAGALFIQSIEDKSELTWTNVAGGVLFSATYN